jgi:hypothetical protein
MHTNENYPDTDDDQTSECENELSLFELVEAVDRIEGDR